MENNNLSRRDFIRLQGLAAGGLALASANITRLEPINQTCDAKKTLC